MSDIKWFGSEPTGNINNTETFIYYSKKYIS